MKLVEWAHAYVEMGWPIVPITDDKIPLVKWKKYQTEDQSHELIDDWWKAHPTAGIAIITGAKSGLVVVDGDGPQAIASINQMGAVSMIQNKTRRGRHYLFAHPGRRVKTQTSWRGAKGVDIRGDGGLFKVYPSRGYEWELPPFMKVKDIPNELPMWEFPEVEKSTEIQDKSNVVQIQEMIEDGNRNHTMTRIVGKMIKDDPAIWGDELLLKVWLENKKRCNPPLEEAEIKTITKSVMDLHKHNNPDEFNDKGQRKESLLTDIERQVKRNIELMRQCDAIGLCGDPPDRDWLVEGIIPAGLPGVLAAGGGVGKTFMLMDLALKVACPQPHKESTFMGHPVRKSGKVVLFLAEDDEHELMRRFEHLDPNYSRIFYPDQLIVISIPELPSAINFGTKHFDAPKLTDQARSWHETLCSFEDLSLVVFDPLQSFFDWRFDEDNVAADRALKWAQSIAVKTGAAVIFTHHLRKEDIGHAPTTPQAAINKIRGASNVVNSSRFAIPIWRPNEDVAEEVAGRLGITANNTVFMAGLGKENFGGDVSTHWLIRDPISGLLVDRTDEVGGSSVELQEKVDAKGVVNQVLLGSHESVSPATIIEKTGLSKAHVTRIVKELTDVGVIYKVEHGCYRHTRQHAGFEEVVETVRQLVKVKTELDEAGDNVVPISTITAGMRSRTKKLLFREAIRKLMQDGNIEKYSVESGANRQQKTMLKCCKTQN